MDPNANLGEQDAILTRWIGDPWSIDLARLAALRRALRAWLESGGFPPEWSEYPTAARYYNGRTRYRLRSATE